MIDVEYDEPDFDPTKSSIRGFARACVPLTLPCVPRHVSLGTGFDTQSTGSGSGSDPWRPSIFPVSNLQQGVGSVEIKGNQCSYRDSFTFSSSQSSDHFSGSLGVTVGNDFLSGSVEASYDRTVQESREVGWLLK